jgi:hypothetical protein
MAWHDTYLIKAAAIAGIGSPERFTLRDAVKPTVLGGALGLLTADRPQTVDTVMQEMSLVPAVGAGAGALESLLMGMYNRKGVAGAVPTKAKDLLTGAKIGGGMGLLAASAKNIVRWLRGGMGRERRKRQDKPAEDDS